MSATPFVMERCPRPVRPLSEPGALADYMKRVADYLDRLVLKIQMMDSGMAQKLPYTLSNITESRTFDATGATLAQTQQVLGTVILDLKAASILRSKS